MTHDKTGARIETLTGDRLRAALPDLRRIRSVVFRDWPYLYDATSTEEQPYTGAYGRSPHTGLVVARVDGAIVGAATCLPMADEDDEITAPFRARGWDLGRFFYFGESVLLKEYRGRGIGVAFFAAREAHALAVSDADYACFCRVVRPADHPSRPSDEVPLDTFWRNRGYVPYPEIVSRFSWREVGHEDEMDHALSYWMRSLRGAALP